MACALGFSISASVCTEAGRIFPLHPRPLRSQAALSPGILGARPVLPAQSLVLLRAGLNGRHLHWGRMGLSPTRERDLGVFGRKGSRQTHSFTEPYAVSAVAECGGSPQACWGRAAPPPGEINRSYCSWGPQQGAVLTTHLPVLVLD